ncbi:hypothetical protein Bphy_4282 [Paraburkholderia phymatum STM815]|uniref:Uncharacterized protein n=1 Tax=Paraburkholderia phymatum (strain DSM 17167 / CIP 108236 / LMG 21445 / STM815) TaxID=391038 RepID=B2JQ61_PARP8|nr:hypothetical protein Bphy_4282 [Paraburkholderia phymatum STM815]
MPRKVRRTASHVFAFAAAPAVGSEAPRFDFSTLYAGFDAEASVRTSSLRFVSFRFVSFRHRADQPVRSPISQVIEQPPSHVASPTQARCADASREALACGSQRNVSKSSYRLSGQRMQQCCNEDIPVQAYNDIERAAVGFPRHIAC